MLTEPKIENGIIEVSIDGETTYIKMSAITKMGFSMYGDGGMYIKLFTGDDKPAILYFTEKLENPVLSMTMMLNEITEAMQS